MQPSGMEDLDSLMQVVLLDTETVDKEKKDEEEVPDRIELNAEFVANYMNDAQRLEEDEDYDIKLVEAVNDANARLYACLDRINTLAFRPGEIKHIELQQLILACMETFDQAREPQERLKEAFGVLRVNVHEFTVLSKEVLIHRPPHKTLLEPGQLPLVSVTTPTLGPQISDEEMLLSEVGLKISL
jgi:hypothetical protein